MGSLKITPFNDEQIGSCYVDLHLGEPEDGTTGIEVRPQQFIVAKTFETVTLADDLAAFMEGRALLAKLGISVEQSSTLVKPGTDNPLILEIFNASNQPRKLEAGMPIAKMVLAKITDEY